MNGIDWGRIDPVMIDADIYRWAMTVDRNGRLGQRASDALREAREGLAASLSELPPDALGYFERCLVLADETVLECGRER